MANRRFRRRTRKVRCDKGKPRASYVRKRKVTIAVTHTPEEMLRAIILGGDEEMYAAIDEAREYFRIQSTPPP